MSDFSMNFAQMAAMFGMFGNPGMGLNLNNIGSGSNLGILPGVTGGIDGLLDAGMGGLAGDIRALDTDIKALVDGLDLADDLSGGDDDAGDDDVGENRGSLLDKDSDAYKANFDDMGRNRNMIVKPDTGNLAGSFGHTLPLSQDFSRNPLAGGLGNPGGIPFGTGWSDPVQQSPWTVTNTGDGRDHIDLGKYTLDLNKQNMQWTLTNKATGQKTDISGDPHVHEGNNAWDFKKNLSFQLDDGTRITVHTIPYGNGQTVSSELDITKGSHGMKVSGLGGNLDGPLKVADGLNGYALDAANAGTDEVYEAGGDWQTFDGTNVTNDVSRQLGL